MGSCLIPGDLTAPHVETSTGLVGQRDLRNATNSHRVYQHCFEAGGRVPEKGAVEGLRDGRIGLGSGTRADHSIAADGPAKTAHVVEAYRSWPLRWAGTRALSDVDFGVGHMKQSDPGSEAPREDC